MLNKKHLHPVTALCGGHSAGFAFPLSCPFLLNLSEIKITSVLSDKVESNQNF